MSTISKMWSNNVQVDFKNDTVDIVNHDASAKGLKLGGTLVTSTAAELNALDGATASATELNYLDIATLGTGAASKAVVLNASSNYTTPGAGTWTFSSGSTANFAGTLQIGGVTLGSTAAEINTRTDDSAMVETSTGTSGALSTSIAVSAIDSTAGAGTRTLAVPTKPAMIKIIKMTVDNGDTTLDLTNIVGGSAATTATFDAVDETLVLVSDVASGKWIVLAEVGVTLS